MIFGLHELGSVIEDNAQVTELLSIFLPGITSAHLHIMRLGTTDGGGGGVGRSRPRAIKVVLPSVDAVIAVFRQSHLLRQNAIYAGVVIRSDKTPAQDAAYKSLREQLKNRTNQGEHGLRIVTRNGAPVIITQPHVVAKEQQTVLPSQAAGCQTASLAHSLPQSYQSQSDTYMLPHALQLGMGDVAKKHRLLKLSIVNNRFISKNIGTSII